MSTFLLRAGRALTPTSEIADAGILIRDGVIEEIGLRSEMRLPNGAEEVSATDQTAAPGFVDVHIHGAGGHDVMEGGAEALAAVTRTVARHGTTSIVATTVTASTDDTVRGVSGIARYISEQHETDEARAEVLGIHFEGPFISPARRGVHPPEWLQLPSAEMLEKLLHAAARHAVLVVAFGHTDATYEQTRAAIAHGAHHAVHVYNAMRPFSHRDSGVIGAVLTSPEVTAELIADGVHVEETAMKVLLQAKGPERMILISDGISATGMPDGKYMLGKFEVTVAGGVCRNVEGKLAGSTLTLDRALRNIVGLGVRLADAVRMLTLNPATLLGIEYKKGVLRTGADADIVLLDEGLRLTRVWARGFAVD